MKYALSAVHYAMVITRRTVQQNEFALDCLASATQRHDDRMSSTVAVISIINTIENENQTMMAKRMERIGDLGFRMC